MIVFKKAAWALGVAAVLAALSSASVLGKERTPDGSFLQYRADTVSELKSQIASDPVAQARYAKFGISTTELMSAIDSGVKLITLTTPTKAQVWYVTKGNRVTSKSKLLPKGTQVFAAHNGEVLLAWSCGNPLRAAIPNLVTAQKPPDNKTVTEKTLQFPPEVVSSLVIASPPSLITETVPALASAEPIMGLPTVEAAAQPLVAGLVPAAVSSGGGLYNLGWLAGLAALASHRSDSPTVPEPGGLVALLTGLGSMGAFAGARVFRRRK